MLSTPRIPCVATVLAVTLHLAALTARAQDCNADGLADAQQAGVQGLTAQYFANRTWSGPPAAVRVDLGGAGGFDLANWALPDGVPADEFSVRWTGGIQFNQSADFQFRVTSDDGYRLYLDGVLIGSSDGVASNQVVPAVPIAVTQGMHFLRLELREDFGEARMRLERKTATATAWNVIANSNFRAGVDSDADGELDVCELGDCNGNGVPDPTDIANDPTLDCNANGIADGCESKAVDCDGNGLPDSCETGRAGLVGLYFATDDFTGPVVARRVDGDGVLGLDFNVSEQSGNNWQPAGVPTDYFSVRWAGSLMVPASGIYQFELVSDDSSSVEIDGVAVIAANTGTSESGPVMLSEGLHFVSMSLREFGGDQRFRVRWRPSGSSEWAPISGSLLATRFDADGDGVSDVCTQGDCDGNRMPDGLQLSLGLAADCDGNGRLDSCDAAAGAPDCNANGVLDACEPGVTGLFGRYYPRLGSSSPKDPYRPGALLAGRRDANISFVNSQWMPTGVPDSNFIAIWTGTITMPAESGTCGFRIASDDGSRLLIDGNMVVDRWLEDQGVGTGSLQLEGGRTYAIRVEFHEGIGEQYIDLRWRLPSQSGDEAFTTIPPSAFRMATPDCNGNGVLDDCDIANGTLSDPGAGIPQPCDAARCEGDLDSSGTVDASDLATLLSAWGSPAGDIDGDGSTSASDIAVLLSNWGPCN